MTDTLMIRRPDDWHLHLRDGETMRRVLPYTARHFARAIVMPNLKPPVTTVAAASAYRDRIIAELPEGMDFTPLMTAYLHDDMPTRVAEEGMADGVLTAMKLYPAGATTHSEYGVTDVRRAYGVLDAMQSLGMPLLVHGEVTDPAVDVFDREPVFIERVLRPLLADFPRLKVVLEHVTTQEAVDFVRADTSGRLAATITPQHLMFNRNAMFMGGIRPHYYCLPVLKRERHRLALRAAATSGDARFFLGTDSAPHARALKEAACGCAGIFNAPTALAAYATVFDEDGALPRLEAFASLNGPRFYGLPPNETCITLRRLDTPAPPEIEIGDGAAATPFLGGQVLPWTVAEVLSSARSLR